MFQHASRLALAAALLAHLPAARAQCWERSAEVLPPTVYEKGAFGARVALQGDFQVATGNLRVYLLERDLGGVNNWGLVKELVSSSGILHWGQALDVDGDVVAVSQLGFTSVTGTVHLFQRDQGGPGNWGLAQVVTGFDSTPGDYYGEFVVLAGTTLVVAAPDAPAPIGRGAVYVYERDSGGPGAWGQVAKIVPSTVSYDYGALALDGDTLAVVPQKGWIELLGRDQGGPDQWGLVAAVPFSGSISMRSPALSGSTLALGLPNDYPNNVGMVWLYERDLGGPNAWGQSLAIHPSVPSNNLSFGESVSLEGDTLLITAPGDDEAAPGAGVVHVHERDQGGSGAWGEVCQLTPAAPPNGSGLGSSMDLDGGRVSVGAAGRDLGYPQVEGLAYASDRNLVYGVTGLPQQFLIELDPATGDASLVASTAPYSFIGLAYDPDVGVLYGTTNANQSQLFRIDPDTGAATLVGSPGLGVLGTLAFDPIGRRLFTVGATLIEIDPSTAVATPIGSPLPFGYIASLAFDPVSNTLYGHARVSTKLIAIDPQTGIGTVVGNCCGVRLEGLAFDTQGGLLKSCDWGQAPPAFVNVNPGTGAMSIIATVGVNAAGTVFVFDRTSFEGYCTAGTSASGCQALIQAAGVPSATLPSGFTLSIPSFEGQKNGLFLYGTNGRQANSWGSGTSYICVVPPRQRGAVQPGTGTVGLCDGFAQEDLNARWCPTCPKPTQNPGPGAVMQAQFWYRDPANTSNQTSSLSDAVEFLICP